MPFFNNAANVAWASASILMSITSVMMAAVAVKFANRPPGTVDAPPQLPQILSEEDMRAWRILLQAFSRICEMKFLLSVLVFVADHPIWSSFIGLGAILAICALVYWLCVGRLLTRIHTVRKDLVTLAAIVQSGFNKNAETVNLVSNILSSLKDRVEELQTDLGKRLQQINTSLDSSSRALTDGLSTQAQELTNLGSFTENVHHQIVDAVLPELRSLNQLVGGVIVPTCDVIGHTIGNLHDPLDNMVNRGIDIQEESLRVLRPLADDPWLKREPKAGGQEHPRVQPVVESSLVPAATGGMGSGSLPVGDGSFGMGTFDAGNWGRQWADQKAAFDSGDGSGGTGAGGQPTPRP